MYATLLYYSRLHFIHTGPLVEPLKPLYLVHTNGECRALNQRAKRRHFCLLFQKCSDLLSNVTL